jgi:hypothetical protein
VLCGDLRQITGGSHHHVDVDGELGADEPLDRGGDRRRRAFRAPEDDIAALQVGGDVRESRVGERDAEVTHRDAVDTTEVDGAEKRHEDHVAIVA